MESDFDQQENVEVRETRTGSILNSAKDVVKHNTAQVHPQEQHQPLIENRNFAIASRNIDLLHSDAYAEMWVDRDKKERHIMFVILGTILVFFLTGAILVYMRVLIKNIPTVNNSTKVPQFVRPTIRASLNATAITHAPPMISIVPGHRYVQYWRNYLYSLDTREETWLNAEQKCAVWQGHLVSVVDADEKEFVQGLQRNLRIWIGYSMSNKTGISVFRWIDNNKPTFEDWDTNDDTDILEDDVYSNCVSQLPLVGGQNSATNGSWRVESCDTKRPFLCKKLSPSTELRQLS